jgi:hypothetical protein
MGMHNALLATIKQRLWQLVIVHSTQTYHMVSQRGFKTPTCGGMTNKTTPTNNNKQSTLYH